jgi:hypothetical protein
MASAIKIYFLASLAGARLEIKKNSTEPGVTASDNL